MAEGTATAAHDAAHDAEDDPVLELGAALAAQHYVVDRPLATVLHLAGRLELPVLLEGEPGVGKTAVAEALAAAQGARLVRLQCYEGLAAHHALYEWDYARQLLEIRIGEAEGVSGTGLRSRIFSPEFLLRRPLLEAIWPSDDRPVLLLIDEVDRADEEFEALLLEVLSQFQVTIPEIGTIRAERKPTIVLTANRTRALSDALRRRCLYHWIPFPSLEREIEIVRTRLPEVSDRLVQRGCLLVQRLRNGYYRKAPGVSETIDWLRALTLFGATDIDRGRIEDTIGCLLKDSEDIAAFLGRDSEQVYREFGLLPDGWTA
ncbi:MoxR family ATPase [Pseudonocardia sp. KRD-184]|uniref:MoxR family ATPase n=1 Tax=Pseudonocardia oceani TaxID=2792013 RepID=A0ABS6UFI5_9PSEU|nr:MoxR family ATPase [Pseudonocardia oceani]MBW0088043.1 MoxR family ATPase [Pseudonocardia oceani]MBW0094462.1 MoxR family ATPase [Pseudonocardia oceani]MBW0107514.1 MoxR family ATPase [Pseudonocardia oceani]MBW0120423.1 MoxR family ATPase [Pseudonocardia oceani]MBW0130619.1 MoxR family ATPase [Pseudonocardia oceani]